MKKRNNSAEGLLPHYELDAAEREINAILSKWSPDCRVVFKEDAAKIVNGYYVRSVRDRHRVCRIIAATGLTERSYEHLSAEWQLHNMAWDLRFFPSRAADADLDYGRNSFWLIDVVVWIMDALNIE